jgi:hypothetical protein
MKKFCLLCILLSPFLVCDPYQAGSVQPDYYTVSGLPANIPASNIPVHNATYGFKLDIGSLPPGTWTVKANACKRASTNWPVGSCSADSNPLVLEPPANPFSPQRQRLVP